MIYEQRIYHAMPGRLPDLLKRFEQTTTLIWARLGIRPIGFWTYAVGGSNHELVYILEWDSMAEREVKWAAFQADPEWIEKREKSEEHGPIITSLTNSFLAPTKFSKLGNAPHV